MGLRIRKRYSIPWTLRFFPLLLWFNEDLSRKNIHLSRRKMKNTCDTKYLNNVSTDFAILD